MLIKSAIMKCIFVKIWFSNYQYLVEVLWGGKNHAYPDSPWCNQKIVLFTASSFNTHLTFAINGALHSENIIFLVEGESPEESE